jgi:hypothetical protein
MAKYVASARLPYYAVSPLERRLRSPQASWTVLAVIAGGAMRRRFINSGLP